MTTEVQTTVELPDLTVPYVTTAVYTVPANRYALCTAACPMTSWSFGVIAQGVPEQSRILNYSNGVSNLKLREGTTVQMVYGGLSASASGALGAGTISSLTCNPYCFFRVNGVDVFNLMRSTYTVTWQQATTINYTRSVSTGIDPRAFFTLYRIPKGNLPLGAAEGE